MSLSQDKIASPSTTTTPNPSNCLEASLQPTILTITTPTSGRCATWNAPKPAQPGDVLLNSLPVSWYLLDQDIRQSHCSYCFLPEADLELESGKRLRRCSACQDMWYCSKACQARDWKFGQHKFHCRAHLEWKEQLVEQNCNFTLTEQDVAECALVVRTLTALKITQNHDNNHDVQDRSCCAAQPVDGLTPTPIQCGAAHWQAMETRVSIADNSHEEEKRQFMAQLIASTLHKQNSETQNSNKTSTKKRSQEEIMQTMKKCAANNFCIVNEMQSPLGAGVYPWAAVLNHSCHPNVIVRYHWRNNHRNQSSKFKPAPPILQLVAIKTILPGTELCHCYVDATLSTKERRSQLRQNYGVEHCLCKRCCGECWVKWPRNVPLCGSKVDELIDEFFWDSSGHAKDQDGGMRVPMEIFQTLQQPPPKDQDQDRDTTTTTANNHVKNDDHELAQTMQTYLQQANTALQTNNLQLECQLLTQALHLHDEAHAPYASRTAYQFCGRLLSTLLLQLSASANTNTERDAICLKALKICRRVIVCQCVLLGHIHELHHPLVGLQLFTLADLYQGCGEIEKATKAYGWARRVLRVTHGSKSDMVQRLDAVLPS